MTQELPPIVLTGKDLIKYRCLLRKYPVLPEFLHHNWGNVKRFIIYALNPRCVIRSYGWRKRNNRVVIRRRCRLLLFDPRLKRMIKKRKAHVKQWSSALVRYYKRMGHVTEHEETELYGEELSKLMKQQLELLKNSKRGISIIEDANRNVELRLEKDKENLSEQLKEKQNKEHQNNITASPIASPKPPTEKETPQSIGNKEETMIIADEAPNSKTEKAAELSTEKSGGSKFLDMLMNKVRVKNFAKESNFSTITEVTDETSDKRAATTELFNDFSEDFIGFDESAHQPGMLLTPLVPQSCKTLDGNGAFVSDALEEYMKKNSLEDRERLLEPMYQDGRVTAHSVPPYMDMPAVPDSLQRLRTVADRRLYLQRSKNQKMAIINNEANVYRELQRKQRQRKVKVAAMQQLQSSSSQMPFTRQGWQAASYVATDQDKYYYQVIRIDGEMVRLPGSQGNNAEREKKPHSNRLNEKELARIKCNPACVDAHLSKEIKLQPTRSGPGNGKIQKLNQYPLPAIFRPCPLSQKPFQKPLDDDTAALLLAGGSMAIVSMPTVQLDVKPQLGRPLDEIAKRYLQHILPHHDITREWAEFSVSTLQEPPNNMREAEDQASQTPAGRRKSFTFVIPYLNDRNHILVRRVVDRSEQLDDSFSAAQPPEKLQEFQFREHLTQSPDAIELDCANMISDMINTVAISCSENSFVSIDPDAASHVLSDISPIKEEGKLDKAEKLANNKQPPRRPSKQQRLTKELRRLNATIIDAGAMAKDAQKPCVKEHCQLGCVCESLAGSLPVREHCGRADCVLECTCTGAELTRIMRVETDGRGISNEDAFNLRRQATARLAKMEKDFTSTLVLTDNETLLINETQCDKKRRCTKAPKRYEDFDDSIEDDDDMVRPSKVSKRETVVKRPRASIETGAATSTISGVGTPPGTSAGVFMPLASNRLPCKVKDTDFMQLKHCRVALRRLPDMENLATFCMTHQLYKCFCGGVATEGKPVVIEKEESDAPSTPYVPELAIRAHYSFERAQEEPQQEQSKKRRKEKATTTQQTKVQNISLPKVEPATPAPKPVSPLNVNLALPEAGIIPERPPEMDIVYSYFRSHLNLCRRVISVPKHSYLRMNRRRSDRIRERIRRSETQQTQDLLNKRIANAVRFYRAELDQQRRQELEEKLSSKKNEEEPYVIIVRDDSDESEPGNPSEQQRLNAEDSSGTDVVQPKRRRQLPAAAEEAKVVKESKDVKEKNKPKPTQVVAQPEIQMPKIASCFSLNTSGSSMDFGVGIRGRTESSTSLDDGSSVDSNFRASYNDVIVKMNSHVSKKMQDIDLALQRESKIIPAPNEDILCIIKWTNFLAAFESEFVFIWDVQMKNYSFLAATITNMMPAVCGAIAVVNTRFSPDPNNLCLMARMLLESKRNENTAHLAVVMQGRQQYWLVKGFLRHMEGNACTKPTPQTHPILTKKINVLCSLMVKQKIREQHKLQLTSGKAASDTSSTASVEPASSPAPAAPALGIPSPAVTPALVASPAPAPVTSPVPVVNPPPVTPVATPQNKETALIIRSNIEFRKVNQADVCSLQIPELNDKDHRWVVLNVYDDFSHIFVPAFRDMISLDRIYHVVRAAHESKKVIKLQFFKDAPYDAFVTPSSKRKIYFGPLPLDTEAPVLVLLQSVDGKMMLREVYQREHNIKVQQERRTMAFWVLQINKQLHFEIDMSTTPLTRKEDALLQQQQQQQLLQMNAKDRNDALDDEDDDDDCMIIDDDDENGDGPGEDSHVQAGHPNVQQEQPQRLNFTIQAVPNLGGGLQIVKTSKTATSSGFMPLIANIPAMGSKAPTTQFLTPQVQVTQTSVPSITSSRAEVNAEPPPAKISRISVQRKTPATATTVAKGTGSGAALKEGLPGTKLNESLQQLLSGGNGNLKIPPGTRGVTITKLNASSPAAAQAVQPIKIGAKRKSSEVSATCTAVKADNETESSSIKPPTILKQTATTISLGNLPVRQVRPLPEKLQQLAAGRKSLPGKQPKASEPRPSLPLLAGNVVTGGAGVAIPEQLPKLPTVQSAVKANKIKYGFMVAKNLPRYRVKLMDSKFMVKIPDEGVLAFKNCTTASVYLNRYLSQNGNHGEFLPGNWKFMAFEGVDQKAASKTTKNVSNPMMTAPIVIED